MKSTKPWKVGRTMQKQVGIGKQDFAALRESQCFYIDKTDFIRQWWNYRDDVTLITRPRRFGKTLNMSMLNCFFPINIQTGEICLKDLISGKIPGTGRFRAHILFYISVLHR